MTRPEIQVPAIEESEKEANVSLQPELYLASTIDELKLENNDELKDFTLILQPIFSEEELDSICSLWKQREEIKKIRTQELLHKESILDKSLADKEEQSLAIIYQNNRRVVSNIEKSENLVDKEEQAALVVRYRLLRRYDEEKENGSISPDTTLRNYLINTNNRLLEELGMKNLVRGYFGNIHSAVNAAFPGFDMKGWELGRVAPNFWSKERCLEAIRWYIDEKLRFDKNDPLNFRDSILGLKLTETFQEYALFTAVTNQGYRIFAQAVIDAYPELKFKVWEFRAKSWREETAESTIIDAIRWMIEERYGIRPTHPHFRQILTKHISLKHLLELGFTGLRKSPGFQSHIKAIILAYPELELKEREFSRVPAGTWKDEGAYDKAINIVKELIEQTLSLNPTDNDFRDKLSKISEIDFKNHRMMKMIRTIFGSYKEAIRAAFPELDIQEWEFSVTKSRFWKDHENVIKAFRWAVETKLGLDPSTENFKKELLGIRIDSLGLKGMFTSIKLTFLAVINLAYPDLHITETEYIDVKRHLYRKLKSSITSDEANEALKALRRM